MSHFNFEYLKCGFRMRRTSWHRDRWICLGESREIDRTMFGNLHLRRLADKLPGITAKILPFIIHFDHGEITMGWPLSQLDFIAGDWEVLQEPV